MTSSIETTGGHFLRSGAAAGAVSSFAFVIVHQLIISNIWTSLPIMLIAGALCGLSLGWTYGLLVHSPSRFSWAGYNSVFIVMFILLGVVSVPVYEPITTVAVLIDTNEPPGELIGKVMPMTIAFTLIAAILITVLFGRKWSKIGAVLLTCFLLVITLGLNVSILGLVAFPSDTLHLIVELFGLVIALGGSFAAVFWALERKRFSRR